MAMKTIISLAAPATTAFDSDRPATSCAWTKRKRSRRALPFNPRSDDEYLALCLIMLANGHIAGHRKVSHRNGSASTEDDDDDSGNSSVLLQGETRRSHECSVCGRSFSSGQALGGHKRSHFDRSGGKQVKGIGKSVSETSGGRRCHDFDLNLLPPSEEAGERSHPSKKARLSIASKVKSEAVL